MKSFFLAMFAACLGLIAIKAADFGEQTIRYRDDTVLKFDSTARIADEDGAWELRNTDFSKVKRDADGMVSITNVAAAHSVSTNSPYVLANTDSPGGAFSVTLPAGVTNGFIVQIKLAGTNALTITNTVGRIDGSTNLVLNTQYQARTLIRYLTNWWIY